MGASIPCCPQQRNQMRNIIIPDLLPNSLPSLPTPKPEGSRIEIPELQINIQEVQQSPIDCLTNKSTDKIEIPDTYKDIQLTINLTLTQVTLIESINYKKVMPLTNAVILKNGDLYAGSLKGGLKEGIGTLQRGEYLSSGTFTQDQLTEGIIINNDILQTGKFNIHGNLDGECRILSMHGYSFKGYMIDGLKFGQGEEIGIDNMYVGEFVEDQRNGEGTLHCEEYTYKGEFKNGMKSGQGSLSYKDGRYYEGEWMDNMKHGMGTFTWPDGSFYVGNFQYDVKEGYGEFQWSDHTIYKGLFHNGIQHGYGIMSDSNGRIQKGVWVEGKYEKVSRESSTINSKYQRK